MIVDDVFDTGRSILAVLERISGLSRRNAPEIIRVATVYYKPNKRKVDLVPDYYIHATDDCLVFPHELEVLTREEVSATKPIALEMPAEAKNWRLYT